MVLVTLGLSAPVRCQFSGVYKQHKYLPDSKYVNVSGRQLGSIVHNLQRKTEIINPWGGP